MAKVNARTLRSLKRKIGSKNLAKAIGVSESTVNRWIKGQYKSTSQDNVTRVTTLRNIYKSVKPTENPLLRDKRFKKVYSPKAKLVETKEYEFTKTFNVRLEVRSRKDVNGAIDQLEEMSYKGKPMIGCWVTQFSKNQHDEDIVFSTKAYPFDEIRQYWEMELDELAEKEDYKIIIIVMSYVISAKGFI